LKVLFIGGTGNISTSVSKLCLDNGIDLYHLNRGKTKTELKGCKNIIGDILNPEEIKKLLENHNWDAVVNWIAFIPNDIEKDIELFRNKTKQYIFISSASAYQKPLAYPVITESTPLCNPFWEYSRNKIACEDLLNAAYRKENFPMTIVRPSYTYDKIFPLSIGGGSEYTIADRMKKGQKIIIHGDGTSLWVMTHAEDFAKAFAGLIGNPFSIGHAFHITSDEVLTWNQIYETLADALGVKMNVKYIPSDYLESIESSLVGNLLGDKAYSVVFDNSKIKTFVPGFRATITFREGIKRTLDWFEADPKRKYINPRTNEMIDRILTAYENHK
jgi:nucleoside-diphosphate-sugar epimerase